MIESDVKGQYIPFLAFLKAAADGQGSLLYSLQKGAGGEMLGLAAYYLLSPYNFIALFFDKENLAYAVELIVLLKIASCGLTMNLFLRKNRGDFWYSLVFSTSYCYIAYNVAYYFNMMWFDGVILLPLVIWGLHDLIRTGNHNLRYILCLAGSMITNFYIGWMICIFCAIYFVSIQIQEKETFRKRLRQFFLFAADSVTAAGLSACILLPVFHTLMESSKKITGIKRDFSFNSSVLGLFRQLFPFAEVDRQNGLPNLFCGTLIVVLCVIMLLHRKTSKRKKAAFLFVIFAFSLSFTWNFINLIWHGFQYNISYPYRYAFIGSFFLLLTAYQIVPDIINSPYFTKHMWAMPILGAIQIAEVFGFALYHMDTGIITVADYNRMNHKVEECMEQIEAQDSSVYRMEKTFHNTYNDSLMLGYCGVSQHTSTANLSDIETLTYYGIQGIQNGCVYRGGVTTLADSLLGIRYLLHQGTDYGQRYRLAGRWQEIDMYYNQYSLPLGFICSGEIDRLWAPNDEANIFEMQNHLAQAMTEKELCPYESVAPESNMTNLTMNSKGEYVVEEGENEGSISYKLPCCPEDERKGMYANIFIRSAGGGIKLKVNDQVVEDCLFEEYQTLYLQPYFRKDRENEIKIVCPQGNSFKLEYAFFYQENLQSVQEWNEILLKNKVELQSVKGSDITGTFELMDGGFSERKLMYSIPYHSNWRLTINGEVYEPESSLYGFLSFDISDLAPGVYRMQLEYRNAGLREGIVITGFCVILVIGISVSRYRKGKQRFVRQAV